MKLLTKIINKQANPGSKIDNARLAVRLQALGSLEARQTEEADGESVGTGL